MWLLAFETLLKFRKGEIQEENKEEQDEEEARDIAERLKQKEEELLWKIEEVDLYWNQKKAKKEKKKPKNKNKKKKDGSASGDTGDELEKEKENEDIGEHKSSDNSDNPG